MPTIPTTVRPDPAASLLSSPWAAAITTVTPVWGALGQMLKSVEAVGSTDAMAIPYIGDSRTEGDALVTAQFSSRTSVLSALIALNFKPGGNWGWTEFATLIQSTQSQVDASKIWSRCRTTMGGGATNRTMYTTIADAVTTYHYWLPSGFNNIGISFGSQQAGNVVNIGIEVAYHAGNVLATQPIVGGTAILTKAFADGADQWPFTTYSRNNSENKKAGDASNFIYGEYQNHHWLIGQNLSLQNVTLRITAPVTFANHFQHLFLQGGGHTPSNYIAVVPYAAWGEAPSIYYDTTTDNVLRAYWPTKGTTSKVGESNIFGRLLKCLRKYQARSWRTSSAGAFSGTTGVSASTVATGNLGDYGATKLVVIDAQYINGINSGLDADADTVVAGKRKIRDAVVGEGGIYIAEFLPSAGYANEVYFRAQMKLMLAESALSTFIDHQACIDASKTVSGKTNRLYGYNAQTLHEGEEFHLSSAQTILEVFKYAKALAA